MALQNRSLLEREGRAERLLTVRLGGIPLLALWSLQEAVGVAKGADQGMVGIVETMCFTLQMQWESRLGPRHQEEVITE